MILKLVTSLLLLAARVSAAAEYDYNKALNGTAHSEDFLERIQTGWRPTYINGLWHGDQNQAVFSSLWEKGTPNTLPWFMRRSVTHAQYLTLSDNMKSKGFHPVVLNGFNLGNGATRFATIWEKNPSIGTWEQHLDLTLDEFKEKREALEPTLKLVTLSGYTVAGELRFAATFGEPEVEGTPDEMYTDGWYQANQTSIDIYRYDDPEDSPTYHPGYIQVHELNGEPAFNWVWAKDTMTDGTWAVNHILTEDRVEEWWDFYLKKGLVPKVFSGWYSPECGVRYVVLFTS